MRKQSEETTKYTAETTNNASKASKVRPKEINHSKPNRTTEGDKALKETYIIHSKTYTEDKKALLFDKFALSMKAQGKGLAQNWDEISDEELVKSIQQCIEGQRWLEIAIYSAQLWYRDWVNFLGRDFLVEGNEPELCLKQQYETQTTLL